MLMPRWRFLGKDAGATLMNAELNPAVICSTIGTWQREGRGQHAITSR